MSTIEDLKERVEELELALEAARQGRDNHEEIEEAMQIAEKALLDKEELELVIERQKQMIIDLQLKMTAELLKNEVEMAAMQTELAKSAKFKDMNGEKDLIIKDLTQRISEYSSTFESLKTVCVNSSSKAKMAEAQLAAQVFKTHEVETQLIESQFLVKEYSDSLQSFQQMAMVDQELLAKSQEVESILRSSLVLKEKELASYKEAFQRLSKIMSEKEAGRISEVSEMKAKIERLEDKVKRSSSFLAPRWQRLADQKSANKSGSKSAESLRSRNAGVSSMMLRFEKQFLVSCIPLELWHTEIHIHDIGSCLARLVYKADNFLEYVFESHYIELMADVEENPLSVQKDRGFIRWLHDSVHVMTSIMETTSILLEAIRESSLADVKDFLIASDIAAEDQNIALIGGGPTGVTANATSRTTESSQEVTDSSLLRCLTSGEHHCDRLLNSAENDYLSPSFDLTVLETFISDLRTILKAKEKTTLGTTMTPIRPIEKSSDFGILPPVLSGALRTLASLAIMGLCDAAYNEIASTAVSSEVWKGLWQASGHVLDKLPFGRRFSEVFQIECLSFGFGYLKPIKRANERTASVTFLTKMQAATAKLQQELCSTSHSETGATDTQIAGELSTIGGLLEKLDQMCQNFIHPHKSESHLSPWNEAIEHVLSRICGVTDIEQSLHELQECQEKKNTELKKAAKEIMEAKEERNQWRNKSSELQMKVERMSLYEQELQELRASDSHYVGLVAQQRLQLDRLENQKKTIMEDNACLNAKLNEATAVLEATKYLPRHQYQSEWDAVEIANLRAINRKLEREIFSLHMEHLNSDLEVSDLSLFLPSSAEVVDTISRKKNSPLLPTIMSSMAHTTVRKVVEDYRLVRSQIFEHIVKVPSFNPVTSAEEMNEAKKSYLSRHSALGLKLSLLQTKIDEISKLTGSNRILHQEFLQGITRPTADELPAVRVTVPGPPWTISGEQVCKLTATTAQLADLNRKLIGSF